jgi:hypothetical protein
MRRRSSVCFVVLLLLAGLVPPAATQDLQAKREKWTQQLAESEPARRRAALREIAMWDPTLQGTYDLVFQGLSDPDVETRIEAGEILVRLLRDTRAAADLVALAGPAQDKNARMKALMAITRVPEAGFDGIDTLRAYTTDPDVGHVARFAVEAVEGRQKWAAAQPRPDPPGATTAGTPAPSPSPTPSSRRAGGGPGVKLWLGLLAVGFGLLTIYLRSNHPDRLGKLEAMKERWGDETGAAVHWVAYTVIPILVGLVLIAAGLGD